MGIASIGCLQGRDKVAGGHGGSIEGDVVAVIGDIIDEAVHFGAEVVEVVAVHVHFAAGEKPNAAHGAFVDFVVGDLHLSAGISLYTDGAAAEEAGAGDSDVAAIVEFKNAA